MCEGITDGALKSWEADSGHGITVLPEDGLLSFLTQ